MKQLVFRLNDEQAALYKSKLAISRTTMQRHLERCIADYLDNNPPADLLTDLRKIGALGPSQPEPDPLGLEGLEAIAAEAKVTGKAELLATADLAPIERMFEELGVDLDEVTP